ncbi:AMP-binding protein [Sneathiella sp. P13V-1]|uniref:AMP-binding protein n=1 Tax=Sneathiella sp. P13V-1 TaxID=2697366 RepID=UPI00187B6722|nr:AMP-binding protein [Sneathiella sp. P13V-1]MBE7636148.1 AMP-binding protein [Sneathiella sp. P13V-1]
MSDVKQVEAGSLAPIGGKSHVVGETSEPLKNQTIPEMLAETVAKFGDREAAVFAETGRRLTYREFAEEIDALASGLVALGLQKGDRIGIWSPNRLEWLLTQFATARIGLILVTINPAYRLSELEYALNKVECKAVVIANEFKTSNYVQMIRDLAPEIDGSEPGSLNAARLPHLKTVIKAGGAPESGFLDFEEVIKKGAPVDVAALDNITATLDPQDAVNIQFTSGTTGSPKGATLTHFNIVNNAHFVTRTLNLTEEDRLTIPVPLYHCFGMVMGTLGCVTKGAAMIFPGEAFEPLQTLETVSKEGATVLYGVPTMFVAMLEHPEFGRMKLDTLRSGIMAGALCPIEIMKKVIAEMHMSEVTIAYGMTETSPVSFQSHVDETLDRRVSTVGRIHPHVEVKVVDEAGEIVPVGQQGEICTRGYSVMQGYWNDDEKTADALGDGGWMHTGDLGIIDEDGYCRISGRVKDMIIRGGENIYPKEIEDFLYTNPKVQEVQIFGVPSDKFGEEVACWIVPVAGAEITEEEIKDFCKGQIAHYKIPRYVRSKSELPMTVTGKPQKFVMRDEMVKELEA